MCTCTLDLALGIAFCCLASLGGLHAWDLGATLGLSVLLPERQFTSSACTSGIVVVELAKLPHTRFTMPQDTIEAWPQTWLTCVV
jgi:hypothetical protein